MVLPKLSVKDRLNLILYDFITEQFTSSDGHEFCTICRQEDFYINAGIFYSGEYAIYAENHRTGQEYFLDTKDKEKFLDKLKEIIDDEHRRQEAIG